MIAAVVSSAVGSESTTEHQALVLHRSHDAFTFLHVSYPPKEYFQYVHGTSSVLGLVSLSGQLALSVHEVGSLPLGSSGWKTFPPAVVMYPAALK